MVTQTCGIFVFGEENRTGKADENPRRKAQEPKGAKALRQSGRMKG
jgi:hypothetical protein